MSTQNEVRMVAGVPLVRDFASNSGSPIVVNTLTATAYYLGPGDIVTAIGNGPPGFDPLYGQSILNLDGQGVNHGTSYPDRSPAANVVSGSAGAETSTSNFLYGVSSIKLNGTTGYLAMPNSAFWNFSTGDFTVEVVFWANSYANAPFLWHHLISQTSATAGWLLEVDANHIIAGFGVQAGSFTSVPVTMPVNAFNYVVLQRHVDQLTFWLNNFQLATVTLVGAGANYDNADVPVVGGGGSTYFTANNLNGFIQAVRVTRAFRPGPFPMPNNSFPNF